jgi:asparagine synthase (glutamine-hydrolysing)
MCGIAGFTRSLVPEADLALLRRMGEVILHRGPDAGGEFLDDRVGLAHRRLSIVDLSPLGNQPMYFAAGRLVIVFNGEIYNFLELRRELEAEGVQFRSHSDTEVILALYLRDGEACLERLNGMFALAIWDTLEQTLFLARDRIGKKPLYYHHAGGDRLAFASEIKSLLQVPGIGRALDASALADYFKYLFVPAPKSIFRDIRKLLPGHYLVLRPGGEPRITQYWDIDFSGGSRPASREQAEGELLELMQDATTRRMVADVPLGAFLSGGIDSSAVVALMARASTGAVHTCSIGFSDKRHDETPYAREVAALFKTEHREYFTKDNLPETVALLPRFLDEPFADSSAVPTYHVSRLARQGVTVALAGDGGDESFAGYDKYSVELKEDLARRLVPRPLLKALAAAAYGFSDTPARKIRSLTGSALSEPARAFYRTNSHIEDQALARLLAPALRQELAGYDPGEYTARYWNRMQGADHVSCMLYTDLKTYLPDDILVKVDRMSMANSLEVRAPLLDYRIVEFAARLPSAWKIQGNRKKILLKGAFGRILPDRILHRPKHGFTVPMDSWFRDELRQLAEGHLFLDSLGEYLDLGEVARIWQEHQDGVAHHGSVLWSLLMFALWHKEYQLS